MLWALFIQYFLKVNIELFIRFYAFPGNLKERFSNLLLFSNEEALYSRNLLNFKVGEISEKRRRFIYNGCVNTPRHTFLFSTEFKWLRFFYFKIAPSMAASWAYAEHFQSVHPITDIAGACTPMCLYVQTCVGVCVRCSCTPEGAQGTYYINVYMNVYIVIPVYIIDIVCSA